MTDWQWRRVLEIYEAVADLPRDAACTFLDSPTEDPVVVREVRVMLESATQAEPDSASVPAETPQPEYEGCVIGRYDVTALIGRGSTGDVYSGRDRELARPVALKFMASEYSSVGSAIDRFIREARAASALNHPNIVTVHEVITWKSSPVIVMELVEGTPLRALCGQPLPLPRAIRIGAQIMQALACAHSIGIVHRDLKPENVMVRPDGYVKVLDLGLARQTILEPGPQNVSSTAGLPVGTLRYMSPEQCRGEAATPASDVFAAGIVLSEMIAGRHPFHAATALDTAHAIAWSEPAPLAQGNPDVPLSMQTLIGRMLSKDAAARPWSAEVAEALTIQGQRTAGGSPAGYASGYRLRALVLSAVLAITLACAVFAASWLRRSDKTFTKATDLRIAPLASLRGAERQPSISADGTRVAFAYSKEKDAGPHIFIKNVSDGALTQLTSGELPDFHPVFSPDGTKLAFLRKGDRRLRIMVTPSAGGIEHQVGEIDNNLGAYTLMAWDQDGQSLVVVDQTGGYWETAIFRISLGAGERRQVTFPPTGTGDWMPSFSPDGRTLGFARLRETGRGDLWEVPSTGGPERRLTDTNEVFYCWGWAADGRNLLIAYRRSGRTYLWRQSVNTRDQARVAGLDDQVIELAVARTGNRIAYRSTAIDDYNVWYYPTAPSTETPKPLIASTAFDGDARYSPDGSRIVFASARSGGMELWMCSRDGSDLRQLTALDHEGFRSGSPSWSPDGRWIAFDSRSPEIERSIFVLDALGGKPKRLTGPGPSDIIPTWSRDSRWVYFSSNRGGGRRQVWKVPLSGGQPVQVTRNGGVELFESPDGRFLYYTDRGRGPGFWRIPASGGEEVFVSKLASAADRSWENTAQGIYFVLNSTTPALSLFTFSTGEVTKIMNLPQQSDQTHRGLSISPDRRGFLYLQADVGTSNLMLVDNFK